MIQTFANLPESIEKSLSSILERQEDDAWVKHAAILHERYISHSKEQNYIADGTDALAYLAMRVPATYAQVYGAFHAVQESIPSFAPKTLLDLGSGPGTAVWAAEEIWPSLEKATCIDQNSNLMLLGQQLAGQNPTVTWKKHDLRRGLLENTTYDIVVIANILNELHPSEGERLLGHAWNLCSGVLVVVESGTPFGCGIVSSVAKKMSKAGNLVAPYVQQSYVSSEDYWIHFPQRFIRPEFSRRIRQYMRESAKMASDWEEAKYAYVAVSKYEPEVTAWGRVVGPVKVQKGFLELPVLTKDKIEIVKILKREKDSYNRVKNIKWGQLVYEQFRQAAFG